MLVLDTMVARSKDAEWILDRRPESDGKLGIPAVVVQELLHQVLKGDSGALSGLKTVCHPRVQVLPEETERIREVFGLPRQLHPSHTLEWKSLASIALNRSPAEMEEAWTRLHAGDRLGTGPEAMRSTKADPAFRDSMRELVDAHSSMVAVGLKKTMADRGGSLSGAQLAHAQRLIHLYLNAHTGLLRAWILYQLAGGVGVPGVSERLRSREEGGDPYTLYNELVAPRYRGGLELMVRLMEAVWLPWLMRETKAPETNDYFDLMIAASVPATDGILVTRETRWLDAATACGLGHRVVTPDTVLAAVPEVRGLVDVPDWTPVEEDRRLPSLRPSPAITTGILARWVRESRLDAAEAYGADSQGTWWPKTGRAGQGQTTTWSWALVCRAAADVPILVLGPLSLTCNWGKKKHRHAREALLEKLWTEEGREHSKYEVQVDFLVSDYQRAGNPLVLACESEASPWHGTGPGMGTQNQRHPELTDDYTWDFYKLLLSPAPFRLFVGRVGPYGEDTQADRIEELKQSMAKVTGWYGERLLAGAELGALILPMKRMERDIVHIGIWSAGAWNWRLTPLAIPQHAPREA